MIKLFFVAMVLIIISACASEPRPYIPGPGMTQNEVVRWRYSR